MQKVITDKYGLHKDETGIYWLLQQGTHSSAVGLPPSQCPFRIKSNFLLCPHKFDLSQKIENLEEKYTKYLEFTKKYELFNLADLQGSSGCVYIETTNLRDFTLVAKLIELYNPTMPLVNPAQFIRSDYTNVANRLKSSNLGIYCIYNTKASDINSVLELATFNEISNSKLILIGEKIAISDNNKSIKSIELTDEERSFLEELSTDDLNKIGNFRLKNIMRNI